MLSNIDEVHRASVTDNKRQDITVYPAKMVEIDELDIIVNNELANYFQSNRTTILGNKIKDDSSNIQTPEEEKSNISIPQEKNGFWTKAKIFWIAYHNHIYGFASIIGVILAVIFWIIPYNKNLDAPNNEPTIQDGIPSTDSWIVNDTFELDFNGKTYPILDKNINLSKEIGILYIGGVNCELLEIGFKSLEGDKLNAVYDTTLQKIKIDFSGDKIIQLKYFDKLFQINQKLTDYNMAGKVEEYYFNYDFYLNELKETTLILKPIEEYR
ncbi:hypothetical protein [Jiulongibacter sp. NS-SX5]|uniref:hypothetical protein n=1 Tax=Jiulongibacter sp. NS-SX5 TaxID=3463854 RepID=UPI004058906A